MKSWKVKYHKYIYRRNGKIGFRLPNGKEIAFWWANLDTELARHNLNYAYFALIAGLAKGNPEQRKMIIEEVDPAGIWDNTFEKYLFDHLVDILKTNVGITIRTDWLTDKIPEYFLKIWNDNKPRKYDVLGELNSLANVLRLYPMNEQLTKAIELANTIGKESSIRRQQIHHQIEEDARRQHEQKTIVRGQD